MKPIRVTKSSKKRTFKKISKTKKFNENVSLSSIIMRTLPKPARLNNKLYQRSRSYRKNWDRRNTTNSQRVCVCNDISIDSLVQNKPTNPVRKWTKKERLAVMASCKNYDAQNTLWLDNKGLKLVQYLPTLVEENLAEELENALVHLVATSSLTIPESQTRYRYLKEWAAKNSVKDCGVLQFTIYVNRGHAHSRPVASADSAGKCRDTEAASDFRLSSAVIKLSELLSVALHAIDKDYWQTCRERVEAAKVEFATLRAQDRCECQCFVGIFVGVNTFVNEHWDTEDVPKGWAAMVVLGKDFGKSQLYFPQLKAALAYERRDVVFFRSRLLQHLTEELTNTGRYVMVFTNREEVFQWLSERYQVSSDSTSTS
jgi:hypothetical protein